MTDESKTVARPKPKLALAVAAVVLAAFLLVMALVIRDQSTSGATGSITQDSYAVEVAAAMEGADADIGASLINEYECYTCHVLGDGSQSPLFDGIANFAGERRPPLSAEQYLYEAIVFPDIHIVEDYTDSMPDDYDERLSEEQVGHIIAYLLTLTEAPPEF